jgi:ubiquinol-cytochrome c reductase cytochrome b subunit
MSAEGISANDPSPRSSRFGEWLNQRVGWRKLMHEGLDEPIPGGSRWAYVFGSGLIFILINQIITGVFLTLYYVPSADHAHTTVSFIVKEVSAGSFVRSLHSYGSSLMIIVLAAHLAQTYIYGAYKSRRELLWLFGCILFLLVLAMSFTGYLLPWDQKAYAATAVATNILSEVPLIGSGLKTLLRGGIEMGTLTLSRFFMLHLFLIPAMIFGALILHVFLFRKAGAAGPPISEEKRKELPVEPFFPNQVFKDFVIGIALIVVLLVLATWRPATLGPMANPGDSTYLPRPEWYYVPIFQWLKYWHGSASFIGIVLTPALLFLALFLLPFIDRRPERRPLKRPIVLSALFLTFGIFIGLGAMSYVEDERDPDVHKKLALQEEQELKFASTPFVPEEAGGLSAGTHRAAHDLSPEASKGALLFVNESCAGCHGPEGKGGENLFALQNLTRMPDDELKALLKKPNETMVEGGMEPVELKEAELDSLVAYLKAVTGDR